MKISVSDHAQEIAELDLDGYAVGGLAVGETHEEMYRILDAVVPHLPENKPTYLMGVGTPANILEAVDRGVDFFDCVYPSRNGRHGHVYTNHGKLNLFNARFELDDKSDRGRMPVSGMPFLFQSVYQTFAESKRDARHAALRASQSVFL